MKNKDFDSIYYDYYSNTTSYVKMILDMLPESKVSNEKKQIIKEIYNFILNNSKKEKVAEIANISALYREKLEVLSIEAIARHVDYMYDIFLNNLMFDSSNRGKVFDIMNESMKVFVGFYNEYQKNYIDSSNYGIRGNIAMR